MSRIDFSLGCVEHEKYFITSGPDERLTHSFMNHVSPSVWMHLNNVFNVSDFEYC